MIIDQRRPRGRTKRRNVGGRVRPWYRNVQAGNCRPVIQGTGSYPPDGMDGNEKPGGGPSSRLEEYRTSRSPRIHILNRSAHIGRTAGSWEKWPTDRNESVSEQPNAWVSPDTRRRYRPPSVGAERSIGAGSPGWKRRARVSRRSMIARATSNDGSSATFPRTITTRSCPGFSRGW